jgi:hypothetical protein
MRTITKRLGAIALTLAACLPMLLSCNENPVDLPAQEGQFTINFGTGEFGTRSAVGTASQLASFETTYKDVTIFQFLVDGEETALTDACYKALNGSRTVTVSGEIGKTYRFYALLNSGDHSADLSAGDSEDKLDGVSISWPLSSRNISNGIPAASGSVDATLAASGTSFTIPCTLLASCWDFKVADDDMNHGSFKVTSLQLRQSPTACSPFIGPNRFTSSESSSVADGDYASSSDLSTLNSGKAVRFYTLENACGTLISNPTMDPWLKVPDSGDGISDCLPTYIEVKGTYTDDSGDLTSENTYRMYLGENNYDNFNVMRGTNYTLTLNLTEEPLNPEYEKSGNWKVETGLTDNRNFQFSPDYHQFESTGTYAIIVTGDDPSYGITYTLEEDSNSAVAHGYDRVGFDQESMTVSANLDGLTSAWGTGIIHLYAWYWDGVLADEFRIVLHPQSQSSDEPDPVTDGHNPYGDPVGIAAINGKTYCIQMGWKSWLAHSSSCTLDHPKIHPSSCTLNHKNKKKSDYVSQDDCPNSYYDYSNCNNKETYTDYSYVKNCRLLFRLFTNYYVNDDGELCCDENTSDALKYGTDYILTGANLWKKDGTSATGGTLDNMSTNGVGFCQFDINDVSNATDAWAANVSVKLTDSNIQDGLSYRSYRIPTLLNGATYNDEIFSASYKAGLTADNSGMLIRTTDPDTQTITPVCTKAYVRTWIISRDCVKFVNDDGKTLNSFKSGDTMTMTIDRSECGTSETIYFLDSCGHIIGTDYLVVRK